MWGAGEEAKLTKLILLEGPRKKLAPETKLKTRELENDNSKSTEGQNSTPWPWTWTWTWTWTAASENGLRLSVDPKAPYEEHTQAPYWSAGSPSDVIKNTCNAREMCRRLASLPAVVCWEAP